jgi:hypothetical protein
MTTSAYENIADADLPAGGFDLVHARWTLLHIAQRGDVLTKLVAAPKPGGTLFLEEPDCLPVQGLDRTGFHYVSMRVFSIVRERGSESFWARELPHMVAALGLRLLRATGEVPYFGGASELAEFWKMSWERVRDGVAASGGDVSAWDRELAELDDPSKLFVGPMTIAVIARKA